MFDELANSFFDTKDDYERGLRLLRQYRVAYKQSRTFSDLEENFLINLDECDDLELTRFGGHLRVPTGGSEYGQVQVKMG